MGEHTPKPSQTPAEIVASDPDATIDLRRDHPMAPYMYGTVSRPTPEGLPAEDEVKLYDATQPVSAEPGVEERRTASGDRVIISRDPEEGTMRHISILPPPHS